MLPTKFLQDSGACQAFHVQPTTDDQAILLADSSFDRSDHTSCDIIEWVQQRNFLPGLLV
jgi:hypothetical protein